MKDDLPATLRDNHHITEAMTDLYDHYYTSHAYEKRYPKPNQSTLHFLFEHGAREARDILDFGCGNGRYALPLLQATSARLTGFDISHAAIAELSRFLQNHPSANRMRLFEGDAGELNSQGDYDLIMLLFGVLSHVGDHTARLATLRQLRSLIRPEGRLILSVPSIFRRRPLELLEARLSRMTGRAQDTQKEPGNILFTRNIDKEAHQFFYHLYSVGGLRAELLEAGFRITALSPESLLPEWMITQSGWLGKLDEALLPLLPAALGYGIRAVAVPV
ncbi:class I SAM-dependent methyltransferase [Undibacterium sp. TS12]|uniref:class I SAM-dependent methyltransferase n=1 Tax=Undibacterium sp. TS12 TaxID=2908202 RepID=UPI001F4CF393|nr:class I SAM-dependent methyltransferase [Undibacterium sp. TS12]